MKAKAYLETSVISYLAAKLSRDLIVAAHQQITQDWWDRRRADFSLCISQLVAEEASAGDDDAIQRRLIFLKELPVLSLTEEAISLARILVTEGALPSKAYGDALHIAVATDHGVDYLLTWNLKHLANAAIRRRINTACRSNGFEPPILCTPEELLEK